MSTAEQVLQALQLQSRTDGQYRTNSPFRPGSDSNSFSLKIDGPELGTWHDFVTDQKGSLYQLAEKLGITIEREQQTTKRAYQDEHDYAREHGVEWSVFQEAGWTIRTVQRRRAMEILTLHGPRWRFLDYRDGSTYLNQTGFQPCWYKLPEAIRAARAAQTPLIYCNGEASTVVAQHFGVPAVSIAGGGERTLTATMLDELKRSWTGAIIVALDCDDKGRLASQKLVTQLRDARFSVHAVDMNLGKGGDLADWCRIYQHEAVAQLQALPVMHAEQLQLVVKREIVSAADLERKQFAALQWTVEDIMPEGCILLAGKPKSRKSWLALHIARSVAMNKLVFSRYKVVQGAVLYMDLESNQRRMQHRLRQMELDNEGQPANLFVVNEWSRGADGVSELDAWLTQRTDCTLVVIDILENFRAPRDPKGNPYTQDYDAVKPLTELAEKHHITILLLHHTRKSKSDDAFDEISGTTGLSGGVSGMFVLARMPAEEDHAELMIRGRDIEADEKRILTWNSELTHHEVMGDAESFLLTKERQEIMQLLSDGLHWKPSDIADGIGKSRQNTHKLLQKLKAAGAIKQDAMGKYFIMQHQRVPVGYDTPAEPAPVSTPAPTPSPEPAVSLLYAIPSTRLEHARALARDPNLEHEYIALCREFLLYSPEMQAQLRMELLQ